MKSGDVAVILLAVIVIELAALVYLLVDLVVWLKTFRYA